MAFDVPSASAWCFLSLRRPQMPLRELGGDSRGLARAPPLEYNRKYVRITTYVN